LSLLQLLITGAGRLAQLETKVKHLTERLNQTVDELQQVKQAIADLSTAVTAELAAIDAKLANAPTAADILSVRDSIATVTKTITDETAKISA
jgi:uncharacterized protein YoxC